MKNSKIFIVVSALLLSMPSYAQAANNEFDSDSVEQCGYDYQKALDATLVTHEAPVTVNKEKMVEIETVKQFVDEYVMNANISDFPSHSELYEYHNEEKVRQVLIDNNGITQDDMIPVMRYLFHSYYFGEYVPKDDQKAALYLGKLLDYFSQEAPEQANNVVMGTFDFMRIYAKDNIGKNNPTWEDDNVDAVFNILVKAGSIETEALLIVEGYGSSNNTCQAIMLPRLTELAEQGSRIAIHKLADTYYNKPDDQIAYWRQKAEDNPLAKYESGF